MARAKYLLQTYGNEDDVEATASATADENSGDKSGNANRYDASILNMICITLSGSFVNCGESLKSCFVRCCSDRESTVAQSY